MAPGVASAQLGQTLYRESLGPSKANWADNPRDGVAADLSGTRTGVGANGLTTHGQNELFVIHNPHAATSYGLSIWAFGSSTKPPGSTIAPDSASQQHIL